MMRSFNISKGIKIFFVFLPLIVSGCSCSDSDYFPYMTTALDVWVSDDYNNKGYYGGRINTNYLKKSEALSTCSAYAHDLAKKHHLSDWSYACCTVTPFSDCATKVR